ncbi:lysoplasmalogenase [Shouchella sp. 1P09AA]|uniref:lysoplasmalogenase n=1 Tax=unclassified Shouchella TaxID=2893065 RepID=UPI0039A284CD
MQARIGLIMLMSMIYILLMNDHPSLIVSVIFKLVPMLLIIYLAISIARTHKANIWVLAGLIVCTVADAAIAFSFLAGLVIFLVGHLLYILGFYKETLKKNRKKGIVLPYALYGLLVGSILIHSMLQASEGALVVPVLFYILVITSMGVVAWWTRNRFVLFGSVLFIGSDSILAWNLFVSAVPHSTVWIMTTYYSAQLFIALSMKRLPLENER